MKNKNLKIAGVTVLILLVFVLLMSGIAFLVVFVDRNNYGGIVAGVVGSIVLLRGSYSIAKYIIEEGV